MKKLLNLKILALIGWVVAALLLLVVLALEMWPLLQPLPATPAPELSSLRRKARQLDALSASSPAGSGIPAAMDRVFLSSGVAVLAGEEDAAQAVPEVILPDLGGVVTVLSRDGSLHHRALLAGRDLGVGDSVDGFRILEISEGRVVLGKGVRRWTLVAPDVPFSLGQE